MAKLETPTSTGTMLKTLDLIITNTYPATLYDNPQMMASVQQNWHKQRAQHHSTKLGRHV